MSGVQDSSNRPDNDSQRGFRGQPLELLTSKLARLFAGTFIVGLTSRLMLLAMSIIVARQLLPEGFGAFTFSVGMALLVSQIAGLGWPAMMTRQIPTLLVNENWPQLHGLLRWANVVVVGGALAALVIVGALSFWPGIAIDLQHGLWLTLLLLVPLCFTFMRRHQLVGAKRPGLGIAAGDMFAPAAVLILALVVGIQDIWLAVVVYCAGAVIGAVFGTVALHRVLPEGVWKAKAENTLKAWMVFALPLLIGVSSKLIMNRMDVVMLGPLAGMEQTGFYGAAFRITFLMTFPQVMLMSVIAPLLAEAIASGKRALMWRHFRLALAFSALTAIPIAVVLNMFSAEIVNLIYGSGYASSAPTLRMLSLGQVFSALSIPCAGLLIAAAKGRVFGAINLSALVLNGGLNFALIPSMGSSGAAIATVLASGVIFFGQAITIFIYRHSLGEISSTGDIGSSGGVSDV